MAEKQRDEIVIGISTNSSPRRRRTGHRNERGRLSRPIQETSRGQEDTRRPVQETQPPQENGAAVQVAQQNERTEHVHAQETTPHGGRPLHVHPDSHNRPVIDRLRDDLWNSSCEVRQLEAKHNELERDRKKIEEDKEKLERENEGLKTQVAHNERELQDKQNEMDRLAKAKDARLESLNKKIDELKKRTASTEKDRHAKIAEYEKKMAEVSKEYEEKLEQCQKEKKDIKTRLNECRNELREKRENILRLEGKIDLLGEQLAKLDQHFVSAKHRAICAHWTWGCIVIVLILSLIVITFVLMTEGNLSCHMFHREPHV